jgi:hypothetical protein
MRAGADLALRARGRFVRALPPRTRPKLPREAWTIKGYPDGYALADLGPR